MKDFEYAAPRFEEEVVGLLSVEPGHTEILAGGTDLIGLMQKMIVTPRRVVNVKEVASMRGIEATSQGVVIGAVTNLDDLVEADDLAPYHAVKQVVRNMASMQLVAQATLGGELCRRPQCWYFRDGHGLLAEEGRRVELGDNRYHAILGNAGGAKFVSASRLAPALIALGARIRILGPGAEDETEMPLEALFRTPRSEQQRENVLLPNQLITHVLLPPVDGVANATYEVRHGAGPDAPSAAAAAALRIAGGVVQDATIVMGHVAPVPWIAAQAAASLVGLSVNHETAARAGEIAVAAATPLSDNAYKVQLARVAVKRAVLLAAGLETGGL